MAGNRHYIGKLIICALSVCLLLGITRLFAEAPPKDYHFQAAVKQYLEGDNEAALVSLKKSLEVNPDNQETLEFINLISGKKKIETPVFRPETSTQPVSTKEQTTKEQTKETTAHINQRQNAPENTPEPVVIKTEGYLPAPEGQKPEIEQKKIEKVSQGPYLSFFYESSNIEQGNRTGHWNEFYYTAGYVHEKFNVYTIISQQERFDEKDYTAALGMYVKIDKDQSAHFETGFGWDVDFIYRLQNIVEYEHRLYKDMFWQFGYTYRAYNSNDTHIFRPGLIYYFGDSYLSANYGVSFKESGGTAQSGAIKGDFAITQFLHWYGGTAFGERLYDIYGLDASQERGYILYTGLSLNIDQDIKLQVGCSYGTEKPKFIQRSINFGITAKF